MASVEYRMKTSDQFTLRQQLAELTDQEIDDLLVGEQAQFGQEGAVAGMVGVNARPEPRAQETLLKIQRVLDAMKLQASQVTAALDRAQAAREFRHQAGEAIGDAPADALDVGGQP